MGDPACSFGGADARVHLRKIVELAEAHGAEYTEVILREGHPIEDITIDRIFAWSAARALMLQSRANDLIMSFSPCPPDLQSLKPLSISSRLYQQSREAFLIFCQWHKSARASPSSTTRLSASLRRLIGVFVLGDDGGCASRAERAFEHVQQQKEEAALQLERVLESHKVHVSAAGASASLRTQEARPPPDQQLKFAWLCAELMVSGGRAHDSDIPFALATWLGRDEPALRQELAEIQEYLVRMKRLTVELQENQDFAAWH